MSQAEKKHTCVLCNTVLESKESLQDHFRKHANKEIDLKGRALGPGGLVKQTTSNGSYIKGSGSQVNTNIVCDVCGEAFTCNTKAIQHKFRKHPFNAAKHYCPQCGMQFPLQGDQEECAHHSKSPLAAHSPHSCLFDSGFSVLSNTSEKTKTITNESKKLAIDEVIKALKENDEFDGIGTNVACKLRRMKEEQQMHAEILINKILLHGLTERLQEETDFIHLKCIQPQSVVSHVSSYSSNIFNEQSTQTQLSELQPLDNDLSSPSLFHDDSSGSVEGHRDKHLKDQHESDHVPRNPYPCYQCGAVFYNKAAHEYHDKSAHHRVVTLYKQILTPPPSKKIRYNNAGEPQSVYYCHLCGLEYIVKFNLQKHIERQHPPEERNVQPAELFKCNTCDALFYNPKAYHNHNIYHRPDDLYVTSEEQRLQTVTRVDQDFDIRRVQPPTERYIPKYRRRRTSIAAPRLSLLISKTKEDEEMSPPPNSDSDDSEEEPPLKKQTKPLNTHSANNKKAAVENNENTQKELSVDTKEKSAVSNDTNSIKNSDDSSLNESTTKSLADLDNKKASEAPGLTLTDDDLGKHSVSVEPSDLGSLPEVASPSAPSAAPVSPRAVNSGTDSLGDLETPEEPILQAL